LFSAPGEPHGAGVQGVVFKNQFRAVRIGQAAFDERKVTILVSAVDFIADDGMAKVGEMDADLMFAAGAGAEAQQREGPRDGG
jgi:hypothetical protein